MSYVCEYVSWGTIIYYYITDMTNQYIVVIVELYN
jgi:hypothetical protein